MGISEEETRKQKIDVLLAEQGWSVRDPSQVLIEVDTKQSDFAAPRYRLYNDTKDNTTESRYADYLLLDGQGFPLAVVEAKRFSKDALIGKKQAEQYADDITRQTGREVFIFVTNGHEIWLWDRARYPWRQVKGFYSQADLERLRFQNEHSTPGPIEVNTSIVSRPKSIENVKRVLEHLDQGHRKALVVMATGTGKTRVAMAIIDALMRQNKAHKVLFLADRIALRNQAWNKGFLQFFPNEAKDKIVQGRFDKTKRLYVSTIQTFQEIYQQKDANGRYLVSPGEFDLIISDEAHRSIYNKWRDVFTYLDAVQIGLTATPADMVERDTFRFFHCDDGIPTANYDYRDAVNDGILVDFRKHILGASTLYQVEGIKASDLNETERNRLAEQGVDPDGLSIEGTELERKFAVQGTSEAIVREFMDHCQKDATGTLPAKSIVFAISKSHARRLWEAFERLYPQYKGQLAEVIVSDNPRAADLIRQFETESMPRVAISVDMLDTGIDVPEVCNLVFAKPVFSKIKFWQMLGRGTRSHAACTHRDWLPRGRKDFFMVFDFWKNLEFWSMNPDGIERDEPDAVTVTIFLRRIQQLDALKERGDPRVERLRKKIEDDIRALPLESISVREKEKEIERALSPSFWDSRGLDPIEYLKKNIMPLMKHQTNVNLQSASFVSKCERLALMLLKNEDGESMEKLKTSIAAMIELLPRTIDDVNDKAPLLDRVLSNSFWDAVTFEDMQTLIYEVAPLMRYMQKEPTTTIVIDMGDIIKQRRLWEWLGDEPAYSLAFKEKVEKKIRELAESDPVVRKIRRGVPVSDDELRALENALAELGITEERLETGPKMTLVDFIRSILDLYDNEDPRERIEDAFQTYMIENNKHYSADQLNFIHTLQTVFASKKHIDIRDMFDAPFTNFGVSAPIPMFEEADLNDFISLCHGLERELFGASG